jgi:polar amino acid transport system substrate-binding protein
MKINTIQYSRQVPVSMRPLFLTISLMLLFSIPCLAGSPLIVSGHPEYPPYMWNQNGELAGIGAEIVKTACQELGLECELRPIDSWKRIQELTRSGEIDIIVGAYANEERKTYMDYSVAYLQDPTSIFVAKARPFAFKTKEDLIGKRGIALFGESYGEEIDTFISEKLELSRTYTTDAAFKNLKDGKVDYMLWGYYPWQIAVKELETPDWCTALPTPLITEGMHITFSKKSKLQKRVPEFNRIIKRLQEDGSIDAWRNEFMQSYQGKGGP